MYPTRRPHETPFPSFQTRGAFFGPRSLGFQRDIADHRPSEATRPNREVQYTRLLLTLSTAVGLVYHIGKASGSQSWTSPMDAQIDHGQAAVACRDGKSQLGNRLIQQLNRERIRQGEIWRGDGERSMSIRMRDHDHGEGSRLLRVYRDPRSPSSVLVTRNGPRCCFNNHIQVRSYMFGAQLPGPSKSSSQSRGPLLPRAAISPFFSFWVYRTCIREFQLIQGRARWNTN